MPASKPRNAPVWLKLFVVLHVCAITIWALPHPTEAALQKKRDPIGTEWLLYWNELHLKSFQPVPGYLFVTGFWQYWDMFSPNPSQKDLWVDADVTFKDGTTKTYQYPRMFLLSLPLKFVKERYRKFYERVDLDNLPSAENTNYLWPVFAQRIAHLCDNPSNPPLTVKLRRHWLLIKAPGVVQPTEYSSYVYYWHAVDSKQLAKDRSL